MKYELVQFTERITARVTEDLKEQTQQYAVSVGLKESDVARMALIQFLTNQAEQN